MSRKKKTDVHANGESNGSVAVLPEPEVTSSLPPNEVRPEPQLEGTPPPEDDRKKPVVTFRLNSDRTTSVSLSVWSNTMVNSQTNETWEQLTITVQRRYRNDQGWQTGGAWRIHDLPCLLFLLAKAHSFALDRRCDDSSLPF